MISSASQSIVSVDQWADRTPVVSTITNLSILILKCARPVIEYLSNKLSCVKNLGENHLVQHIFNKSASRCLTLLVPFVGNFLIYKDDEKAKRLALAEELFERGNEVSPLFEKCVPFWKIAADLGNAKALVKMGHAYNGGIGVKQDFKKSFECFKQSEQLGESSSFFPLGYAYDIGRGTAKNKKLAEAYYEKAAKLGDGNACCNLGICSIESGNLKTAFYWFCEGAKLKDTKSMNLVGEAYRDGKGVKKDDQEAFKYFKEAAEHGNVNGLNNLGEAYFKGRGVEKNLALAETNLKKAYQYGSSSSAYLLGTVYEEQKQFAKAKELYQRGLYSDRQGMEERLDKLEKKSKGSFSFFNRS